MNFGKGFLSLALLFVLSDAVIAQDDTLRFYHDLDVLVFSGDGKGYSSWFGFKGYVLPPYIGTTTACFPGPGSIIWPWTQFRCVDCFVDSNGVLALGPFDGPIEKLFPVPPIERDSIWTPKNNDSVGFIVTRKVDTVVFNTLTKAYYFDLRKKSNGNIQNGYNGISSIIVTDTFGVIHFGSPLYNARIRGKEYLTQKTPFNFKPLCVNNEWHYQYVGAGGVSKGNERITGDTIINGLVYYKLFDSHHADKIRYWRSDSNGIYELADPGENLIHKQYIWLGMWLGLPIHTIEVADCYGRKRTRFKQAGGSIGYGYDYVICDSLGLIEESGYDRDYEWHNTLTAYKICGEEYPEPVGIDKPPATLSPSLGQNYPNPVSLSASVTNIPITAMHGGPAQLVLTDALGRQVRRMEYGGEQTTITVNIQGLPPGVYWYGFEGSASLRRMLIVIP